MAAAEKQAGATLAGSACKFCREQIATARRHRDEGLRLPESSRQLWMTSALTKAHANGTLNGHARVGSSWIVRTATAMQRVVIGTNRAGG
jgi:hypothetical protein